MQGEGAHAPKTPAKGEIFVYRQQNNARGCYGLLRAVPGVCGGSVFYQGPCPARTAARGGVCVCGCGCETPLDP